VGLCLSSALRRLEMQTQLNDLALGWGAGDVDEAKPES